MHIVIIVKKQGICMDLDMVNAKKENLKLQLLKPQFHNASKFDFSLIITYLAEKCTHSNISCIAHSMETFLTFSITNFV